MTHVGISATGGAGPFLLRGQDEEGIVGTENKQCVNWRKMMGEADAGSTQRRPIRANMAGFMEHLLSARPQAIHLMRKGPFYLHFRSMEVEKLGHMHIL